MITPPYIAHIDLTVAILLSLFLLVGLSGNLLAFLYFFRKPRRDLSAFLYVAICAVDFCTCALQPPVIVSLVSGRSPGLFDIYNFCAAWGVVYDYCQRISMFLVMLLSVSRYLAIVRPFVARRKRTIIGVLVGYVLFISLHNLVTLNHNMFWWGKDAPYCYNEAKEGVEGVAVLVDEWLYTAEVGVPVLLAWISFILSTLSLLQMTRSGDKGGAGRAAVKQSKRASVTITMFTGLVLVCNLPYFICNLLFAVSEGLGHEYPGPLFRSPFMFWYSWLLSKVVLVVLNASTNPVLYVWRMNDFKSWVVTGKREAVRRMSNSPNSREQNPYPSIVERSVVIANRIAFTRYQTTEIK